jgi:hypothetical protein
MPLPLRPAAALLLCLALATAACAPEEDASPAPLADPPGEAPAAEARPLPPTEYDREILERARAEEAEHLPAEGLPGVVRTGWDRLEITAGDGTRRVFADSVEEGHLLWVHLYRGRPAPLDAHVVEKRHIPEGWEFVLVEGSNGRMTELDVPPVASPDGRRLVTAFVDLVAGYTPNRIRVYRMEPSGPVLEWEREPTTWGAESPVWEDERTIRLTWATLVDDHDVQYQPEPIFLELTAKGWAFREGAPD